MEYAVSVRSYRSYRNINDSSITSSAINKTDMTQPIFTRFSDASAMRFKWSISSISSGCISLINTPFLTPFPLDKRMNQTSKRRRYRLSLVVLAAAHLLSSDGSKNKNRNGCLTPNRKR
jgi:hypothetical protein